MHKPWKKVFSHPIRDSCHLPPSFFFLPRTPSPTPIHTNSCIVSQTNSLLSVPSARLLFIHRVTLTPQLQLDTQTESHHHALEIPNQDWRFTGKRNTTEFSVFIGTICLSAALQAVCYVGIHHHCVKGCSWWPVGLFLRGAESRKFTCRILNVWTTQFGWNVWRKLHYLKFKTEKIRDLWL